MCVLTEDAFFVLQLLQGASSESRRLRFFSFLLGGRVISCALCTLHDKHQESLKAEEPEAF